MSIDGALKALATPREPDALPAPDGAAAEGRDAILDYHKRKAIKHRERGDAARTLAQREYDEVLMWHRKFVEKYDSHRDNLSPKTRDKLDGMRTEIDNLVQHVEEQKEAWHELFRPATKIHTCQSM